MKVFHGISDNHGNIHSEVLDILRWFWLLLIAQSKSFLWCKLAAQWPSKSRLTIPREVRPSVSREPKAFTQNPPISCRHLHPVVLRPVRFHAPCNRLPGRSRGQSPLISSSRFGTRTGLFGMGQMRRQSPRTGKSCPASVRDMHSFGIDREGVSMNIRSVSSPARNR